MRHLNPLKTHSGRMTKTISCLKKKIYGKIELKNNICINVYFCEKGMVYHVYLFIGDSR